jgi:hypothetical protein
MKRPVSAKKFGKNLTFPFFEMEAEASITRPRFLQKSKKSRMLRKCRLGVSYQL